MRIRPIFGSLVGTPVAVEVNGPDVIAILGKKIHQRIVANLQVKEWATGPRASMDEECDLAVVREGAFQASFVFLPQVNSKAISHHVVIFAANEVGSGSRVPRRIPCAAVGCGHDCARGQDQNQKRESMLHCSQYHFTPPHEYFFHTATGCTKNPRAAVVKSAPRKIWQAPDALWSCPARQGRWRTAPFPRVQWVRRDLAASTSARRCAGSCRPCYLPRMRGRCDRSLRRRHSPRREATVWSSDSGPPRPLYQS